MPNSDEAATPRVDTPADLLRALHARDPAVVARIDRLYGRELETFCRRMLGDAGLAEDAKQDVLAACCTVESAQLPHSSLRGWLYQVARRRCIDLIRRRNTSGQAAPAPGPGMLDELVDPLTTPAGRVLKRDRADRMLAALQSLDEDLRSVLVMRYLQGLPREDIAASLGISLAGAKARLSRAVGALRQRLQRVDDSVA